MKDFLSFILCISFSIISIVCIYAQRKKKFTLFTMNMLAYMILMCISIYTMTYDGMNTPMSFYCSDEIVNTSTGSYWLYTIVIDHCWLFTIMLIAFIIVNRTLFTVLIKAEEVLKKE